MRFLLLVFFALCILACIDEYTDTIELSEDGSAQFSASIFPCEYDSSVIEAIRADYDSIEGLKFDSAWFSQRDSLYELNFKLSFENLFSFFNDKKIEKDFVGHISLKKIDSIKNGYSFERIINPGAEHEEGIVPEESISAFALEQIIKNDSSKWEYTLILPKGAVLISSEPVDTAYISKKENSGILHWKIPAAEAISKRTLLKADFFIPAKIDWPSLIGIAIGCIIMLLAIILLFRKLKKLSITLRELKNKEKNLTGE
jgi:hypothetical protein